MLRVAVIFYAVVVSVGPASVWGSPIADNIQQSNQLVRPINATWGETYKNKTRPDSVCTYQLSAKNGTVGRIEIILDEKDLEIPLLVVLRQPTGIISFAVPVMIEDLPYNSTGRTIEPFSYDHNITIEFSSYKPVNFRFKPYLLEEKFDLPLDKSVTMNVAIAHSVYHSFTMPNDTDSVTVRVDSQAPSCMTVSVQPVGIPVSDLSSNVISQGMYQTMTRSASIVVRRMDYPKFYVVFVLKTDGYECSQMMKIKPAKTHPKRAAIIISKAFNVTIESKMNQSEYLAPIAIMVLILLVIFIVSTYYMRFEMFYDNSDSERFREFRDDMSIREEQHYPDPQDDHSIRSYDILEDANEREVVRAKPHLMVSDLAMKTYEQRNEKYNKYVFYLCTIALFYLLPTVQLVLYGIDNLRSYGNLDSCWYNFRCARPFWIFIAFNNVVSNSAYVFLGALLIIMTYERYSQYREHVAKEPVLETELGLPQHPSLMYAIGIAIVLEGLLSASYHFCPTPTNYQFDTSFMYVIALLGMLKIYQLRHPDITASAHVFFAVVAGFILIAMLGVRFNNSTVVWAMLPVGYVIMMFMVSIEFYFKGVWRISFPGLKNTLRYTWASSKWCSCLLPKYRERFCFLFFANVINLFFITYGEILKPTDFASFLLFPMIANLFLYLLYYIVMKFSHGERLSLRALAFLAISATCWSASLWFFFHRSSDWSKPPAISRELNSPCIVLNFFDTHDVWHFLSAVAMFISFILLDRIDDDLRFVERTRIPVF